MNPELEEEISQLHAQMCGAVADRNRIRILYVVAEKPHNVNDIAEHLNLPQPTTSRHLKILRERGLVIAHREGQMIFYKLADARIIEALDLMRGVLAARLEEQGALGQQVTREIAHDELGGK